MRYFADSLQMWQQMGCLQQRDTFQAWIDCLSTCFLFALPSQLQKRSSNAKWLTVRSVDSDEALRRSQASQDRSVSTHTAYTITEFWRFIELKIKILCWLRNLVRVINVAKRWSEIKKCSLISYQLNLTSCDMVFDCSWPEIRNVDFVAICCSITLW